MWAESAAGGFSKKKIDLSVNPLQKSPEKHSIKEVAKKDSGAGMNSTGMGSTKKPMAKLHLMSNTDSQ